MHIFSISWDRPPAFRSLVALLGYKIVYHPVTVNPTNVTITVDPSMTTYSIAGLERNQIYCVRVLAYNEYGDGEISNCTKVKTAQGKKYVLIN